MISLFVGMRLIFRLQHKELWSLCLGGKAEDKIPEAAAARLKIRKMRLRTVMIKFLLNLHVLPPTSTPSLVCQARAFARILLASVLHCSSSALLFDATRGLSVDSSRSEKRSAEPVSTQLSQG